MTKKQTPRIKFGNIKGNVVVSNNQSGGVTTHGSNPNNDDKFKYLKWIGGIIAFIASVVGIFTWFNIFPPHKNLNQSPMARQTNALTMPDTNKSKTVNQPVKKKAMFGKKDNEQPKYQIGDVSGDVVISTNQTGGITAHTVVVPEDKEIPLKDNIQMELTTYQGAPAIKISPKQGMWENSFFAVPNGEMASKNIRFHASSLVMTDYVDGTIDYSFADGNHPQTFQYQKWVSPKTNAKNPFYLTYDGLPTAIVCGEWGDSNKQYTIRSK